MTVSCTVALITQTPTQCLLTGQSDRWRGATGRQRRHKCNQRRTQDAERKLRLKSSTYNDVCACFVILSPASVRDSLFSGRRPVAAASSSSSSNPYSSSSSSRRVGHGSGNGADDRHYAEQTESLFEQQNNALLSALNSKVDMLKQLSIDIGEEARNQNKMLDGMVRY